MMALKFYPLSSFLMQLCCWCARYCFGFQQLFSAQVNVSCYSTVLPQSYNMHVRPWICEGLLTCLGCPSLLMTMLITVPPKYNYVLQIFGTIAPTCLFLWNLGSYDLFLKDFPGTSDTADKGDFMPSFLILHTFASPGNDSTISPHHLNLNHRIKYAFPS